MSKLKLKKQHEVHNVPHDLHAVSIHELRYLSQISLPIYGELSHKPRSAVPPISPKELIYDYNHTELPKTFPKLENLKLPMVKEVGVKGSIEKLADLFHCTQYKKNLIQFWFLDIITDCLWRSQDEFQFTDKQQKVVLEWVLFVFNLIRAAEYNLPRKKLFELFKEAMSLAEEYIETGCLIVPSPDELFTLNLVEKVRSRSDLLSNSSDSSKSTISLESNNEDYSYIAVKTDENTEFFKLLEAKCAWNIEDECLTSSEGTMSEDEKPCVVIDISSQNEQSKETIPLFDEGDFGFYKPDMSTPPRFRDSDESIRSQISESLPTLEIEEEVESIQENKVWKDIPRFPQLEKCPSELVTIKQTINKKVPKSATKFDNKTVSNPPSNPPPGLTDEDILEAWHNYYLWQHRLECMNDPTIGWLVEQSDEKPKTSGSLKKEMKRIRKLKKEWMEYIEDRKYRRHKREEMIFINTCVLLAIKQFVFDYFYESFQYTLIRIAFRCPHHVIAQCINESWCVPKVLKSEFKRPKPRKRKKEKKKKEKKPKKEKTPKKPKDKSSKKSKDKSSKKTKSTKGDKEKKVKEKPKALTKEEKAELARLQKEEEMLKEKQRIEEENKHFMFPLTDAADETFFRNIFGSNIRLDKGHKEKKEKKKRKK